jgi:phosphate transport system ATP-binding protein
MVHVQREYSVSKVFMLAEQPLINTSPVILRTENLTVKYGPREEVAVEDVTMNIHAGVTALIGPSGCGKSTVLRCFNRMNDRIIGAKVEGNIYYHNRDILGFDPVSLRTRIGMVFQKPNPFPKSIFDNIAFGPRLLGVRNKKELNEIVEESLRKAAIFDEVKDFLHKNATDLSGGQQQRICIARAIAIHPEVILMDEPCSALDPISTLAIEELIKQLKQEHTIVIVTHNMQQAARISGMTAFFNAEIDSKTGKKRGYLAEYNSTEIIFSKPRHEVTERYISGKFG